MCHPRYGSEVLKVSPNPEATRKSSLEIWVKENDVIEAKEFLRNLLSSETWISWQLYWRDCMYKCIKLHKPNLNDELLFHCFPASYFIKLYIDTQKQAILLHKNRTKKTIVISLKLYENISFMTCLSRLRYRTCNFCFGRQTGLT